MEELRDRAAEWIALYDVFDLVALIIMFIVSLIFARFAKKRPLTTGALLSTWVAWFSHRLYLNRSDAWKELSDLGIDAFESTHRVAESFARMMLSWSKLVAPFVIDGCMLLVSLWGLLSPQERFMIVLLILICLACWKTFTAVRDNAKRIRRILFHLSFIFVAPALWYLIRTAASDKWMPFVVETSLTWIPFALSFSAFRHAAILRAKTSASSNCSKISWNQWMKKGFTSTHSQTSSTSPYVVSAPLRRAQNQCGKWLSFWSCWPLFVLLADLAETLELASQGSDDDNDDAGMNISVDGMSKEQGTSLSPRDLKCLVITMAVYCQFWDGSNMFVALFAPILSTIAGLISGAIPSLTNALGGNLGIASSMWNVVTFVRKNKIYLAIFSVVIAIVSMRFFFVAFSAVGSALKTLVIWGAAADAWRTVNQRLSPVYEQKLSFWILSIMLSLLTHVPLVGLFLSLWEPLILSATLVVGETFLQFLVLTALEPFFSRSYRKIKRV